jgi:hypothetical protein
MHNKKVEDEDEILEYAAKIAYDLVKIKTGKGIAGK